MEDKNSLNSLLIGLTAIVVAQGGEVFVPDIVLASIDTRKDLLEVVQDPVREGHIIRVARLSGHNASVTN